MQFEKYYGLTVYEMLKKNTDLYGDKIVFSFMRDEKIVEVTHKEFLQDVRKVAYQFEKRNLKGKYIVVEGKAQYELVTAFYAAASMGAVAAVFNMDLPEEEIFEAMDCIHTAMVVSTEDNYDIADDYAKNNNIESMCSFSDEKEVSIRQWIDEGGELYEYDGKQKPEDPALVLMTSGSTSKSKLVLLPHYVYMPDKEIYAETSILVFPTYHVAGIAVLGNSMSRGTQICLSNMKDGVRDLEWFKAEDITAVPAFISVLIKRSRQNLMDLSHFKYITSAGAPQNLEEADYLRSLGIFSSSTYGATEVGGSVIYATPTETKFGSVGKPGPWNEITTSELGEILIRGKSVMHEYIGAPEETAEVLAGGWYHSGDVGFIDEDGFLHVTGRIKNIIILSNGENVSPEAIEKQLYHCNEIDEVVVYGEGDTIVAHVWCGEPADDETKQLVQKFVAKYNRTVPSYRAVRDIVFRDAPFEKTATGKIKR